MAFKSDKNILHTELEIFIESYLSDVDFLIFCMSWNNPHPEPYTTNPDELKFRFANRIKLLSNNINLCDQVFYGNIADTAIIQGRLSIEGLLKKFIATYLEFRVGDENLEWINNKDDRQISLIKHLLSHINLTNLNNNMFALDSFRSLSSDRHIIGDKNPFTDRESSLNTIKNTLSCLPTTKTKKIMIINEMKSAWLLANLKNKFPSWIKKEDTKTILEWLPLQAPFTLGNDFYLLREYKSYGYAKLGTLYFDLHFIFSPDRAELELIRLRKAWSQVKTRAKNQNKPQINFSLSPDIKTILEDACKTTGLSRNSFVEIAIRNEHERVKKIIKEGS